MNQIHHAIFTFAMLAAMAAPLFSAPALPLKNTGFEEGLSLWQKSESKGAEATWAIDESIFHGGSKSLRVANASPRSPNVYGTLWQSLAVESGKTYRLRVWVRGQKASGVRFTIDKKWSVRKGPPEGSFDWQEISLVYKVPEGETAVDVRLICENVTEGLWVDDLSLAEEEPPVKKSSATLGNGGAMGFLPLFFGTMKIDGDLSDWQGHAGLALPAGVDQVVMPGWKGNDDLSALVQMAWDEAFFYFSARVVDDIVTAISGEGQYAGDGLQLGFGKGASYGPEYGVSGNNGVVSLWCWQKGSAATGLSSLQWAVSQVGHETRYEGAIPWKAIFAQGRPQGPMAFNFLINDNDGKGRKGYLEWRPGIGHSKEPLRFPRLVLVPKGEKFGVALGEPAEPFYKGDRGTLSVWAWNRDLPGGDFDLSLPVGPLSLSLKPGALTQIDFDDRFEIPGEIEKSATLAAGDEKARSRVFVQVKDFNTNTLKASYQALAEKLGQLEGRFKECEGAKIPTDREKVSLMVIRSFIGYGLADAENGRLSRSAYVLGDLTQRLGKTMASLDTLLAKTQSPRPLWRSRGGPITLQNGHLWGAQVNERGDTKEGPVQLLGYGHFGQSRKDIPRFQDFGHNVIQQEIGPRHTVFPGNGGAAFSVDYKVLDESIVPMLKTAESNHISVCLLLSPHYFPKWALEKWPELANPTSGNFLTVIPDAPEAKAILEAHITAVVGKVRGMAALNSLCLANEPELIDTRKSPFSQQHWKQFLEKRHVTIKVLNMRWGTSHASFEEVPMQDPAKPQPTPAFYDHSVWNAERFSGWHQWMAEVVHRLAPEIPVHVKIMQNIFERSDRVGRGVNPEAFCLLSDYAGCDAWLWPGDENWGRDQFAFYDLLHSIKGQPIFNSEDHYILDRDATYTPDRARHVTSALFMGAFHGREASTAWVWERTFDPKHDFEGSVLHRPDVVAEAGLISLELQNQASLVAAFNDAKANVAILYSWPSLVYSPFYGSTLKTVYDALRQNGQKVSFVTEDQLRQKGAPEVPVLVLPASSHLGTGVLAALERYVGAGGKIVTVGENVISKDEWNQALPDVSRNRVLKGALAFPQLPAFETLRRELAAHFEKQGLGGMALRDTATGELVSGVEYRGLEQGGNRFVVALNFGPSPKKVRASFGGRECVGFLDLLKDREQNFADITLEPLTPVLLKVK